MILIVKYAVMMRERKKELLLAFIVTNWGITRQILLPPLWIAMY